LNIASGDTGDLDIGGTAGLEACCSWSAAVAEPSRSDQKAAAGSLGTAAIREHDVKMTLHAAKWTPGQDLFHGCSLRPWKPETTTQRRKTK
jgi:hypothetical protein